MIYDLEFGVLTKNQTVLSLSEAKSKQTKIHKEITLKYDLLLCLGRESERETK